MKWLLRFIGIGTIPAFIAAVMPQDWLACLINKAEPGISVGILVTYLARVLMAIYALVGLQCIIIAADVKRYRPLIFILGVGTFIIALAGLIVLFCAVPPDHRTSIFWIVFADFAEGFAQAILILILLLNIPKSEYRQQ